MATLILAVSFAVIVSFACSLTEAALYAVPWSAIERARHGGLRSGELLFRLRSEVDKPIAAVLTLNTIANTAGSAVAGAAFMAVFGPEWMALFALAFTVLILTLGEVVPKTLGVAYCTPVMLAMARPLTICMRILSPAIWLLGLLTRTSAKQGGGAPQVTEDDIRAIASLSRKAGKIKDYEERFVRNVLALDQKRVYDIMTPRTVVFSLPAASSIDDAFASPDTWHFSRIPVYGENNEDLVGLVDRRALALCARDRTAGRTLAEIMTPLHFVQETQTLDMLLREFLQARVHLFAVVDEYGGLAGVVALEDVMEEILGWEIVDESDNVADLRSLARQKRRELRREARDRIDRTEGKGEAG